MADAASHHRLVRATALAVIATASLTLSGCVTWRESPQGAAPRHIESKQKVELSVRAGGETNPVGVAMLIGKEFAAAGYDPTLVPPEAVASGPTVARVDISAGMATRGKWTAILSGLFVTLVPAFVTHDTMVEGTVAIGDGKQPYHNQGAAKIAIWLPLIIAAPFQQGEMEQVDNYFRDVGKDLVRTVQAMQAASPTPDPAPAPTKP